MGGSNTLNLVNAFVPTTNDAKASASATPAQIGVTINLAENTGQVQNVYQGQLSNPDIGSLVDPSLLTSSSTASLSLEGTFKTVIAGSDDIIYAASAYAGSASSLSSVSGTAIILSGTANTVYCARRALNVACTRRRATA